MSFKILAINPGSTSTKVALYRDKRPLFELTLRHSPEDIAKFKCVTDQYEWRKELIVNALRDNSYKIEELSAVISRGGLTKPIPAGVYEVNDQLCYDNSISTIEHASNLGAAIALSIAKSANIKAYIADPAIVDEMMPVARFSGLPEAPRKSIFHALNTRAVGRHCAENTLGSCYENVNLIIAHMGGGVTVSMHSKGRVIDTTCGVGGDGAFSPERAGRVFPSTIVDMCYSGEYTKQEMHAKITGKGGIMAHIGTNSMMEVVRRVDEHDEKAKMVIDAYIYNVAKDIGAMSTVVCGKVDGVILTGGIAFNHYITNALTMRCQGIAPVYIYPGENELESLAHNAYAVLNGDTEAKIYE